ncbi:hypothetical protein BDA96_10G111600 [Sorghum bicolor]|uniref:Uncharacterized protein n=1 Tax=Sorghum bicolor TaxID=4558 RepID=A0A921Q0T9_SORBI|nr:hypothetical protein BDA96_10G111600 [Sorghum bicolor]
MLLHAEQLAAAAAEHLCPTAAAAVFRSSLAQLSVAHGRAAKGPRLLLRRTAKAGTTPDVSASKSLLAPFIGLYLVMGAVLHSKSLTATNRPGRRPAALVKTSSAPIRRPRALAISVASPVETVMADGAPNFPQDASAASSMCRPPRRPRIAVALVKSSRALPSAHARQARRVALCASACRAALRLGHARSQC